MLTELLARGGVGRQPRLSTLTQGSQTRTATGPGQEPEAGSHLAAAQAPRCQSLQFLLHNMIFVCEIPTYSKPLAKN